MIELIRKGILPILLFSGLILVFFSYYYKLTVVDNIDSYLNNSREQMVRLAEQYVAAEPQILLDSVNLNNNTSIASIYESINEIESFQSDTTDQLNLFYGLSILGSFLFISGLIVRYVLIGNKEEHKTVKKIRIKDEFSTNYRDLLLSEISNGEIKKGLDFFKNVLEPNQPTIENEIALYSHNLNQLRKEFDLGLIEVKEKNLKENKIIFGVLNLSAKTFS